MKEYRPDRAALAEALQGLLLPIARFALRNSLTLQDITAMTKVALLEAGKEELAKSTKKINLSRLSVLTGLHRIDLHKMVKGKQLPSVAEPSDILNRVLAHWRTDPRFCSKNGRPRTLSFRGDSNEFTKLCESISLSINPGTVLFELERSDYVKRTTHGLKHSSRMLSLRDDPRLAYRTLGQQIDAYIRAVEENLMPDERLDNLHIFTSFDNIFVRDIPLIRRWLVRQGGLFHRRVRRFVSKFDKDLNPGRYKENAEAGANVAVGAFSFADRAVVEDSKKK